MKSIVLMLVGFASPVVAQDYPHRDWGQVLTLDMTLVDATACIAQELNRRGNVLVVPAEGGSDIDYAVKPMWGPKKDPWERFKLRSDAGTTTLRLFYRHPVTQKGAGKDIAWLQKRCLRVKRTDPA